MKINRNMEPLDDAQIINDALRMYAASTFTAMAALVRRGCGPVQLKEELGQAMRAVEMTEMQFYPQAR